MWFKNLQVFRFTKPFEFEAQALSEQLSEHAFVPCGGQDVSRYGWVPPLGAAGTEYVHAANGYMMICAKKQDKVLPAAVINEQLAEKVLAIQSSEGRAVGRKERQTLKEELTFDLLPRAFTRSTLQFAYFAQAEGLLVVNSASANRAQELLNYLRDCIDSLPVIPLAAKNTPQQVMTHWLESGCPPKGFELGHECELRDPSDEGGVIRCKHQVLNSPDIINHIKSGMYVNKLGLLSEAGIEFTIDDELAIKRLVFDDIIQEKANQVDAQDAAEQFDVDFSIMTLEVSALIKSLLKAFGGEKTPDPEAAIINSKNVITEAEPENEVEVELA
jgi:recombination associated protein RdgC